MRTTCPFSGAERGPRPQTPTTIRSARETRADFVAAWPLLLVLVACGGAPTMMDVHRQTLDDYARRRMDCPEGAVVVSDATPDDFAYGADPEARRYDVEACGATESFVCFRSPEVSVAETLSECRRFGERQPRVYLGPFPL